MSTNDDKNEAMGCLVWLVIILGLCFLFWGEPDVWDALRAKAMSGLQVEPQHPNGEVPRG